MAVAGQVLGGKYRLERLLGSGGFASVWQARHEQLGRPVAIKVLSDNLALKPDFVERFLREARLASRPIHETICQVEDLGTTEDAVPYLVMELLTGRSLSDELRARGALPFEVTAEIGRLALQGLAAAHAQGIVHRDVKPANLFLCSRETPGPSLRILDFGLAKDLGEADGFTTTEQFMGTPDFFPPEYFVGEWRDYGPEGDVFALGVVLFSALVGRRPLDGIVSRGDQRTAFYERASYYSTHDSLPSPGDLAPDVPAELDLVVSRAIAVEPTLRYADAGEMLVAWEAAVVSLQAAGVLPVLDPSASRPPAALLFAGPAAPADREPSRPYVTKAASRSAGPPVSSYGPFVGDSRSGPRPRPRTLWLVVPAAVSVVLVALLAYGLLGPDDPPGQGAATSPGGGPGGAGALTAGPDGGPGPGPDAADGAPVMDFSEGSAAAGQGGPAPDAGTRSGPEPDPPAARRPGPGPRTKQTGRGKRPGRGGDDYRAVPFDQIGRGN